MNGQRLKQLRLARGFSLEELAAAMGGAVTKQALSKYEHGKAVPTPRVLDKLAAALGVKAARLWQQPGIQVEFVAYRKRARLGKRAQERVESVVRQGLEDRVRLQMLTQPDGDADLPIQSLDAGTTEDAEQIAEDLRDRWHLGREPIPSLTGVLEDHHFHVIEIEAEDDFDGLSACAREGDRIIAAAVVARKDVDGGRQRLSLAHELGHLALRVGEPRLAESVAFRFAGAFLAPAATVRREVGVRRTFLQLEELLLLKQRFGLSIQALLYRLRDLRIITESLYRQWCVDISKKGWRTREPQPLPPEQSVWLRQNALRAFSEGALSRDEAAGIFRAQINSKPPLGLVERRAFLKLPIEERRRMLAEQAEQAASHYEADQDWQGGNAIEY